MKITSLFVVGCSTIAVLIVWSGCRNSESTHLEPRARLERELIRTYESRPSDYQGDEVLPVAAAYVHAERIESALKIYEDFTAREPQDSRGWLGAGCVHLVLERYGDAIASFQKADSLGNPDAARMLAAAYAGDKSWDRVRELSERLLKYASDCEESDEERYEVIGILVVASACSEPKDEKLFDDCLQLLPKKTSEWRKDVQNAVVAMLEATNDQRRLEVYRRGNNPGR